LVAGVRAAEDAGTIPGVGPRGPIAAHHSGFRFTEGPAADAQGRVYFSDVQANRIHRLDPDGRLTTFLEDSQGCNGLMFDGRGRLLACQGAAGRVIAIDVTTKQITVLAEKFNGKPLDRPNDLVVDRSGGVYFTDPSARSVYYVAPGGAMTRPISDLPRPNGVILSPDETRLYVLPSGTPDVMDYPVEAPGRLGPGRVFCTLRQDPATPARGGDGLAVDTRGNLYLTQPALKAIQVVAPDGQTLGLIRVPESPSNCDFGGPDLRTLYITARTSLYAVPMEAQGHRFGGR
ncbi:MAG TPA: SMP-30/gluconolactonase/LRE family protein, partial [Isosphaeraceae bacterium]